jgi:hypothetical protein
MPFVDREMAVAVRVGEIDSMFAQVSAEPGSDVVREEDPVPLGAFHSPDPVVDRDPADGVGSSELDREDPLPPSDGQLDAGIRPDIAFPPGAPDHSGLLEEREIGEALQVGAQIGGGFHGRYSSTS